jgi:hypothetical protein
MLPRGRRQMAITGVTNLLFGGFCLMQGLEVLGFALLAVSATAALAGPPLLVWTRARLERALTLNGEIAAGGATRPRP